MRKSTRFSVRASLAGVGQWMCQQGIGEKVEVRVSIQQKKLRSSALEKLLDAFMNILAGDMGWLRSTRGSKAMRVCRKRLGGTDVSSNR